jgi:hypothetical protein
MVFQPTSNEKFRREHRFDGRMSLVIGRLNVDDVVGEVLMNPTTVVTDCVHLNCLGARALGEMLIKVAVICRVVVVELMRSVIHLIEHIEASHHVIVHKLAVVMLFWRNGEVRFLTTTEQSSD